MPNFFISFQKAYKSDWESDKAMVYYPVHLTDEYEVQQSVEKSRSDVSFADALKVPKILHNQLIPYIGQIQTSIWRKQK